MLQEFKNVKQHPDEGKRRWFNSKDFDLIIWYGHDNIIEGFQLCYDKEIREHSITWKKEGGYTHNVIDDGEDFESFKRSPILLSDGLFDKIRVIEEFKKASLDMDKNLVKFIIDKLSEYMF